MVLKAVSTANTHFSTDTTQAENIISSICFIKLQRNRLAGTEQSSAAAFKSAPKCSIDKTLACFSLKEAHAHTTGVTAGNHSA
jgi:hypothetical protein